MRRFLVLGDPVAHSRSPVIHNAAFAFYGLDAHYDAARVDRAGLDEVGMAIRHGELAGANITMPHKEAAFEISDRVVGPAVTARSVNTWLREDGRLVGASSDVPGIVSTWSRMELGDGPAHLLGAGGAASAALVALSKRSLSISARSEAKARQLLDTVGVDAVVTPWSEPVEAVVVNCTPLGMHGEPLPGAVLETATGLFEMAYGPTPTPAALDCRRRGLPVADGLDLLVAQAAVSFEMWWDLPAPFETMMSAARK